MNKENLVSLAPDTFTYKIYYGGWYQRTTLHLSEIYEFFDKANTYLNLDKNKIIQFHKTLEISSVSRKLGYLEYIELHTKLGIILKYYEDGLYVLSVDAYDIPKSKEVLENYCMQKLTPAINYLFSLGAPTPKLLANIKTVHPTVVTCSYNNEDSKKTFDWLNHIYSVIEFDKMKVQKSSEYILIQTDKSLNKVSEDLVEMQIFFREFKDQLEKYLSIHRKLWEEITNIKEAKDVRTKDLEIIRNKLDIYQKTISLISNRINQMGSYAKTRKSIAQQAGVDQHLVSLFQYRFESMLDTLDYIKEIWKMTTDYVNSAIQVLTEAQAAINTKSIQSLTLITSIGVIAGLVGHLSRDIYPKITLIGVSYLSMLLVVGWSLNKLVQVTLGNKKQKLKFKDTAKNL